MTDYSIYADEYLVKRLQENAAPEETDALMDYLLEKYKPLVRKLTNKLFIIGAESDDLIQEGMIGLFKAIRDYREDMDNSFYSFAQLCIRRQVISAIESGNRKKNQPLNSSLSINMGDEEGESSIEDFLENAKSDNPEELILEREAWNEFVQKLEDNLSTMERQVLTLYLEGKPYTEIARFLNREPKAIDNAIQRIRKKVSALRGQ